MIYKFYLKASIQKKWKHIFMQNVYVYSTIIHSSPKVEKNLNVN